MNKAFHNNRERYLARSQSIIKGIEAAQAGYTVSVNQMFNSLALIAPRHNPSDAVFSEPAARGFSDVIAQISVTSPILGEQMFTAVADMLQKLQEFPDLGVDGQYPNTRELAFFGYPVTLVYTVDEDAEVTVVAVFYSSETLS